MNSLELRVPPPLVALALGIAMWGVSRVTFSPVAGGFPNTAIAAAIALLGGAVSVAGVISFLRARTTVNPHRPENASFLVRGGIYRVTRNPMYLGLALVLAAWAVFLLNPWSVLGPVLFVLYMTRFQIQPEERALLSLFGQQYADYMQRVRRWI
jgi:protein-S-isoprenylcysteine O-methyltransferase Ste14